MNPQKTGVENRPLKATQDNMGGSCECRELRSNASFCDGVWRPRHHLHTPLLTRARVDRVKEATACCSSVARSANERSPFSAEDAHYYERGRSILLSPYARGHISPSSS